MIEFLAGLFPDALYYRLTDKACPIPAEAEVLPEYTVKQLNEMRKE